MGDPSGIGGFLVEGGGGEGLEGANRKKEMEKNLKLGKNLKNRKIIFWL